jgi:hypothetical protein
MKHTKWLLTTILSLFLFSTIGFSQKLTKEQSDAFKVLEDDMSALVDSFRSTIVLDERMDINMEFIKILRRTLAVSNSYLYPFENLKERMHILPSPDGNFRIFNWVVTSSNFKKTYFGAIQFASGKVVPLLDYSEQLEDMGRATDVTNNKEWYGVEYYHIMKDVAFGQPVYLLFGFNSNTTKFNRKLIDVLSIKGEEVTFGAPILRTPNAKGNPVITNRFIQYFKKNATTMLNWDANLGMIVFTRLESEISAPSRLDTYIPAGPIDGLKKEGDIWQYQREVLKILKLSDGKAPVDGVMN